MSGKAIKLVALDLDGTTLNSHHDLTKRTIDVLRKVSERGVIVTIATGRSIAAVLHLLEIMKLPQKEIHIVCYNGALGATIRIKEDGSMEKEVKFHTPLPDHHTRSVLAFADSLGCVSQYYHAYTGEIFAVPKNEEHRSLLQRYENLTGHRQIFLSDYSEALAITPTAKLLIMTNQPDLVIERAKSEISRDLTIIRGSPDPFFVEFLDNGVTKGRGVELLCNSLGVSLDEIAAFGDGDNDKEMLELAGLSITPSNAKQTAKSAAKKVSQHSNDEDCVAIELEYLLEQNLFHLS